MLRRSFGWSVECPVYFDNNGTTTYKGMGATVEVWFQADDDHPWKERSFAPRLVRTLTPEAAVAEIVEIEAAIASAEKAEKDKAAAKETFEAYVAALPPVVAGVSRGGAGCRESEFCDDSGNYLFAVPKKAAAENWSLAQLETWVEVELEAYFDGGE